MTIKETFIENLSKITSGMKQKEIAKIMGCTEGTMSKYLNVNKKDFPTVEMLYNLSHHFNVSIDWLIGRAQQEENATELSQRNICKIIAKIYNSQNKFTFGTITVTEDCYDTIEYNGVMSGETTYNRKKNTYISLYFSERCDPFDENEYFEIQQLGNHLERYANINTFLSRFKKISDMYSSGDIDREMYDRLLESYLNDVPDTTH